MGKLDTIVNLVTLGAGVFIFIKVFPLVQGLLGGAAPAAAPRIPYVTYTPEPPLDIPAEIEKRAAAGVIPGTAIGVGQEAFAQPDVRSLLLQLLAQQVPADAPLDQPPVVPPVLPPVYQAPAPAPEFVLPPIYKAPVVPPVVLPPVQVPSGWAAGRVVGSGVTGGQAWERVATGIDKEATTRWL